MEHCKRGKGLGEVWWGQIELTVHENSSMHSKHMRPAPTALFFGQGRLDWRCYDLRPRVHTSSGAIMKPPSVPNGSREAN